VNGGNRLKNSTEFRTCFASKIKRGPAKAGSLCFRPRIHMSASEQVYRYDSIQ
jgi:hypothetical protein